MLKSIDRLTIIHLKRRGTGKRAIAKSMGISRNTVKKVLRCGNADIAPIRRKNSFNQYRDLIRDLLVECKGNRFRVWEKLLEQGVNLPYSTLTEGCRRWLGDTTRGKEPAGEYKFAPGTEMQTDTSPHKVIIAGKQEAVQCAALWLGYSRMLFAQGYPTFNRFLCKVFLTEALTYFQGACSSCSVDNTSVVVASGSGVNAVIAPEMVAFSKRFHFDFKAHAIGDANRSAGVERSFWFIEKNFYPGRTFASWDDLNQQFRQWCESVNARHRQRLKAKPNELFREERVHMQQLPIHIPEVYNLHQRTVDSSAYVQVHTNLYSVPKEYIGREVEIQETYHEIRVYARYQLIASHQREQDGRYLKRTLPEHEWEGRHRQHKKKIIQPIPEEITLRHGPTVLGEMVDMVKQQKKGQVFRTIRELNRLYLEYPEEALCEVLQTALQYQLTDINRIEKMILRHISGNYFRLPEKKDTSHE